MDVIPTWRVSYSTPRSIRISTMSFDVAQTKLLPFVEVLIDNNVRFIQIARVDDEVPGDD